MANTSQCSNIIKQEKIKNGKNNYQKAEMGRKRFWAAALTHPKHHLPEGSIAHRVFQSHAQATRGK